MRRGRLSRVPSQVYSLAADMDGMGFIENNKALCMLSVLINTHLLMEARDADVHRFFYASSQGMIGSPAMPIFFSPPAEQTLPWTGA